MLHSKLVDYYDDIEISITNIKSRPIQNFLVDLQDGLNKFFSDSECKAVIYTHNQDKPFFGVYVMPSIDSDEVIKAITKDKRLRVKEYYVELDSKLFEPYLNLNIHEITAIIMHDIGTLVSTSAPAEEVSKNIDQYLVDNHETLKLSDLVHYKEILSFGFRDALRKCTAIFELGKYKEDEDTLAQFITWVPYVKHINSALDKVSKLGWNFNKELDNRFIGLSWVLRVYRDVLGYRISAIKTLERMQELSPSQIEKKEFNNFARRLHRIDDDMLLEETNILLEEIRRNHFNLSTSNVLDELDYAKNDYIGLLMKEKDIENEPDAMPDLMNCMNKQMMMIKDYVEENEHNKDAFKQWNQIYKELARKRNNLSKNKLYVTKRSMINKYKASKDQ